MSTFERHPAFKRGLDRTRQVRLLRDIAAVMPLSEPARKAGKWVDVAIEDERAVLHALRALDEMPEAERHTVFCQSRAMA